MELTHDEMELIKQYRALSQYDKGRVDGHIDYLLLEKREKEKKLWKIYEKGNET